MAYPVETVISQSDDSASASITVALPAHQEGDVVFLHFVQDCNSTPTLTVTPSGVWTTINSGYSSGCMRLLMYAVVGASQLADVLIETTIPDGITAIAVTVRDADVTGSPIDNSGVNTGVLPACPSFSTSTANTLLLGFLALDSVCYPRFSLDAAVVLGQSDYGGITNWVGYKVQASAGSISPIGAYQYGTSDGGGFNLVAVKNKTGGGIPPELRNAPIYVAHFGPTQTTLSGLTTVTSAIDGYTTYNGTQQSAYPSQSLIPEDWGEYCRCGGGSIASSPGYYGSVFSVSTVDLTDGVLTLSLRQNTSVGFPLSTNPTIFIVVDGSNNWAAYAIHKKRSWLLGDAREQWIVDIENSTPIDSSGTSPDLSAIVKIGFATGRFSTTNTSTHNHLFFKDIYFWPRSSPLTMVGGSEASPAGPVALANAMVAAKVPGVFLRQGGGQAVVRVPFRLGNGSEASYIRLSPGASSEFGVNYRLVEINPDMLFARVKAGASDVVTLGDGVLASDSRQLLVIDPASSPSASFDFSGLVIAGLEIENNTSGIPITGAAIVRSPGVSLLGGALDGCAVRNSVATVAVTTDDPGNITDCEFISSGTGHAIEITTPGTYTFAGNTFSGYGADGTTDAAIYNNSGGAVTLNITGGGDTPTVRNGTSASTTINNNVSITLTGIVVGSSIRVELVSDGSLVEFRTAASSTEVFSVAGSVAYRIKIRKASTAPYYRPWSTTITPTADGSISVEQELD